MATPVIYPTGTSVYARVIDTTGLSEVHIDYGPSIVMVLTGSWPVTQSAILFQGMDTGSLYPISCSWALQVVSASATLSSSWALSSSYAANAGGTQQLNATVPTFKIYATASLVGSSTTNYDVTAYAYVTTSNARADGADFRVFRTDDAGNISGSYLPTAVAVMFQSGSTVGYQVWWSDTYVSNSVQKYMITYGDPNGDYTNFGNNNGIQSK